MLSGEQCFNLEALRFILKASLVVSSNCVMPAFAGMTKGGKGSGLRFKPVMTMDAVVS